MSGSPTSKIWTSALQLDTKYFQFNDNVYSKFGGRDEFAKDFLGAHFEERNGVNVPVINPRRYIESVSNVIHQVDSGSEVFGIVHDKDGEMVNGVFTPKTPHLHLLIKYSRTHRLNNVVGMTGILQNLLQKSHTKGRYAFSSAMSYLTHAMSLDSENKHDYDPKEVINGVGNSINYVDYYNEHKQQWEQNKHTKAQKDRQLDFDRVLDLTLDGKINKDDFLDRQNNPELYKLYGRNKNALDEARNTFLESRFKEYLREIQDGKLPLQVLFINGKAGSGKSMLASAVANKLISVSSKGEHKWRKFDSASKDSMEGMDAEEIIIMDDARANTLNASDWLKLLDPHNGHTIHARYHNASPMPRLIIITATSTPHEFFTYVPSVAKDEPLDQFLRRIFWSCQVVNIKDIYVGKSLDIGHEVKSKLIDSKGLNSAEKSFHYVYGNYANGDFDQVVNSLVAYYSTVFGLSNSEGENPLNIKPNSHKEITTYLPIQHDDGRKLLTDLHDDKDLF